jgi:multiple sugar transport system permease protein
MDVLRLHAKRIATYALLIVWSLFTLFPLYWTVVTSIKTRAAVTGQIPTFIPWVDFSPTLDAWRNIFGGGEGYRASGMGDLGLLMRNSLTASLGSATLAVILGTMAAYGLSRFRYRRWNNRHIAFWMVSQRMLPPIALAVPFFIFFDRIGIYDTVLSLVLVYTAANLPIVVWLLRDYFRDLPIELEEAAQVDGATRVGAFVRIALPLVLPGLVVAFLFAFVFAWNEFLFALELTLSDAKTLPVQISGNVNVRGTQYWDIAAQGLVVMFPPIVVALLAGRYIVRGLTLGAVKR